MERRGRRRDCNVHRARITDSKNSRNVAYKKILLPDFIYSSNGTPIAENEGIIIVYRVIIY
jgi:hypothetical protein